MKLQRFRHSPRVRLEWVLALGLVGVMGAGCGSSSSGTGNPGESTSGSGGSGSSNAGSGSSTSSGSSNSGSAAASGGEGPTSSGSFQPPQSGSGSEIGDDASATTSPDGAEPPASDASFVPPDVSAPPSCMKGTVMPDEVVMLGDSYMAPPPFGDVAANIIAAARKGGALASGKLYREFWESGAAVNNGAGQLNIPYQYNTMAKGNVADQQRRDRHKPQRHQSRHHGWGRKRRPHRSKELPLRRDGGRDTGGQVGRHGGASPPSTTPGPP